MRLRKRMEKMKKQAGVNSDLNNFKMNEEEKNSFNQKAKKMLSEELTSVEQVADELIKVFEELYGSIHISADYHVDYTPDDTRKGTWYGESVIDNYDNVAIDIEDQVKNSEKGDVSIPIFMQDEEHYEVDAEETPYSIKIEWEKLSSGNYKLSAEVK